MSSDVIVLIAQLVGTGLACVLLGMLVMAAFVLCGEDKDRISDEDSEMIDWLDKHARVNFSFEEAKIEIDVPDDFAGANAVRDIIRAGMEMEAEHDAVS